jgi:hypothetical protein
MIDLELMLAKLAFHDGLEHAEIAELVGLSRQRVAQIERKALNKLRFLCDSKFRGVHVIYDAEGVPEPKVDSRDYAESVVRRKRVGGRFAKETT